MQILNSAYISSLIKPRAKNSHKGTYGHSLIVAGHRAAMGAAVIAAKACLRSGTGLLTISTAAEERLILQTALPEAMLLLRNKKIDFTKYNAVGIGCALGTGKKAFRLLENTFTNFTKPLVADADAITILAQHPALWKTIPANSILTPHPKEFERIAGAHFNVEEQRLKASKMAAEKNIVIVLKGHETFITNGIENFINSTGNAGLAKGGSGDMLTGILTALLAQGYNPLQAACAGVYIHGLAADISLATQSMESMLATDVTENIGKAFKTLAAN